MAILLSVFAAALTRIGSYFLFGTSASDGTAYMSPGWTKGAHTAWSNELDGHDEPLASGTTVLAMKPGNGDTRILRAWDVSGSEPRQLREASVEIDAAGDPFTAVSILVSGHQVVDLRTGTTIDAPWPNVGVSVGRAGSVVITCAKDGKCAGRDASTATLTRLWEGDLA